MQQTAIPASRASARPWYAHRWPWLLMAGPLTVIAAAAYTAKLAYTQQDALVVDDYYKQGNAINRDLRRERAAAALGVQADLRYDAVAGRLTGTIGSVRPLAGSAFVLRLIHPTQPAKDLMFAIRPARDGSFSAALPMLDLAHWQVLVESSNGDWRLGGSWSWPQQKTVSIKAD